ncbi:MAG: acetyl/propionyl-CoA carboxylase subunit alpha, partial [Gordonia sp. (in: high G+C Gram-positive bacteria)]
PRPPGDVWASAVGWRIGDPAPVITRFVWGAQHFTVSITVDHLTGQQLSGPATVVADDDPARAVWQAQITYRHVVRGPGAGEVRRLIVDGVSQSWSKAHIDGVWWVSGPHGTWQLEPARTAADEAADAHAGEITSPMPGTVVAVPVTDGASVTAGTPVVVVEAMKMEHTLTAPEDGVVAVSVTAGDKVGAGQILAAVTPASGPLGQEEN